MGSKLGECNYHIRVLEGGDLMNLFRKKFKCFNKRNRWGRRGNTRKIFKFLVIWGTCCLSGVLSVIPELSFPSLEALRGVGNTSVEVAVQCVHQEKIA